MFNGPTTDEILQLAAQFLAPYEDLFSVVMSVGATAMIARIVWSIWRR